MKPAMILLLLAALLVAMPAAAVTLDRVGDGADAPVLGTKINMGEEVAGEILAGEIMTAIAVPPDEQVNEGTNIRFGFINVSPNYWNTRAAQLEGGDGLFARFS